MDIKSLRRRMGWTSSDLARRLGVGSKEIEIWEGGRDPQDPRLLSQLEFLFRQAEVCCDEIRRGALAESILDESSLGQIPMSQVKDSNAS